jgi:hypothetical protein
MYRVGSQTGDSALVALQCLQLVSCLEALLGNLRLSNSTEILKICMFELVDPTKRRLSATARQEQFFFAFSCLTFCFV